jgi:hypothetical protein
MPNRSQIARDVLPMMLLVSELQAARGIRVTMQEAVQLSYRCADIFLEQYEKELPPQEIIDWRRVPYIGDDFESWKQKNGGHK